MNGVITYYKNCYSIQKDSLLKILNINNNK